MPVYVCTYVPIYAVLENDNLNSLLAAMDM